MQIEKARGDPAATQIDGPGVAGSRLARSEVRLDAAVAQQQPARLRCGGFGIEQQEIAQADALHGGLDSIRGPTIALSSGGKSAPMQEDSR